MASHPSIQLNVGLCGGGLGGMATAISLARAGCKVTVLEASAQLGEIGAGIQMTPNASRLLRRWGVAEIIGHNLVEPQSARMRVSDGKIVGYVELTPSTREYLGFPWWTVHRHHLLQGLTEAARRLGVSIITDARVTNLKYEKSPVEVTTSKGNKYTFDLLIGSDGLNSTIRKILFPNVTPQAPTTNAAYRATIPYTQLFAKHPELKPVFGANTFDIWQGERGYVITYPISGGELLNLVLSHHRPEKVEAVEEVDMIDFRSYYATWDPSLVKVINLINETQRWPLLAIPPMKSWSSPNSNVVLIGDAAHSMTNHMAQGAATAMEDGAFLGRCLLEVNRGMISLREAVEIYEKKRMPRAWAKQQASFMMGDLYMLPEGAESDARNMASCKEIYGAEPPPPWELSWNIWGSANTSPHIYAYDAESSADFAIIEHLQNKSISNPITFVSQGLEKKWKGWFLEKGGRMVGKEKL